MNTIHLGLLTYQLGGETRSLPLLYPDMIEEDSSLVNTLHCSNDDSILSFMGADDSYIRRSLPSETQAMLNESTFDISLLGTHDIPRILKIKKSLDATESKYFFVFLEQYSEAFAWSYSDMPGIDPTIVVHNIVTIVDAKPVKQKL